MDLGLRLRVTALVVTEKLMPIFQISRVDRSLYIYPRPTSFLNCSRSFLESIFWMAEVLYRKEGKDRFVWSLVIFCQRSRLQTLAQKIRKQRFDVFVLL